MTKVAQIGIALGATTVIGIIIYMVLKPKAAAAAPPVLYQVAPPPPQPPHVVVTTNPNGSMFATSVVPLNNGQATTSVVPLANGQNLTSDQASSLLNRALQNPDSVAGMVAAMALKNR